MPWLVGVVADAYSLRWGLAIAAFTPLLMLFSSHPTHVHYLRSPPPFLFFCIFRLPCVYYLKKFKQASADPSVELMQCAEEADSRPMFVSRDSLFSPSHLAHSPFCRLTEQEPESA